MAYYPDTREEERFLEHEFGPHPYTVHLGNRNELIFFCRNCEIEMFGRSEVFGHHKRFHGHQGYGGHSYPNSGYGPSRQDNYRGSSRHEPYPSRGNRPYHSEPSYEDRYSSPGGRGYNNRGSGYQQRGYNDRPSHGRDDYNRDSQYDAPPFSRDQNIRNGSSRSYPESDPPPPPHASQAPPAPTTAPPPPPSIAGEVRKIPLKDSPVGALLEKLSQCVIKTPDDADLALNVATALIKFGKEFHLKKGNVKNLELLVETELKVGTVNVLKSLHS